MDEIYWRFYLAGCQILQTEQRDTVSGLDLVVVLRVGKGQREHALLLQVGLVDASKAADDDRAAAQGSRAACSLLLPSPARRGDE